MLRVSGDGAGVDWVGISNRMVKIGLLLFQEGTVSVKALIKVRASCLASSRNSKEVRWLDQSEPKRIHFHRRSEKKCGVSSSEWRDIGGFYTEEWRYLIWFWESNSLPVVLRIHSSEAWVITRTLVKWLSEEFRQVYNNGGLDQGGSSGQVMHISWRQSQKDFLTDWRWGLRERGRVKNHSNSFEGRNWKYGLAIGADIGFEGPKFSIQFWGPTSGKWTQDYKTKLDIW